MYQRNTGALTDTPGLALVHKLKYEHIYLTSFSKMRVDLAVQVCCIIIHSTLEGHVNYLKVLSSSVANALRLTGGAEACETCDFVEKMDKFFDCFNVSSYTASRKAKKEF